MKLARLYRTARYLQLRQILARIRFRLRRVNVGHIDKTKLALIDGAWTISVRKKVDILGTFRFKLLNKMIEVRQPGDWNDPKQDKLLLYHLHYHDALNDAGNNSAAFDGAALIDRWIADNPPVAGNGWEPYCLSLRIVNWIKWHLEGNTLAQPAINSLLLQARALSQQIEYHLLGNHIFANAKALYFAGLFFDGPESSLWKRTAIEIFNSELAEQILADGGHFELSPMYQATITEDVLDILNIGRAYGDSAFAELPELAQGMIYWLAVMSHGDGMPSYFNDSTIDIAPLLEDIDAYASRLGVTANTTITDGIVRLSDSGYVRYQSGSVGIIIDVGQIGPDYQPGHAHCDCLSFELSIGENRILVNTGISTYNVNQRRLLERKTSAHNTVSIEGLEQSEVWSAFRVGRRARPVDVEIGDTFVCAAHDGFDRANLRHRRRISFNEDMCVVHDILDGNKLRHRTANFHCHPNVTPVLDGNTVRAGPVTLTFDKAMHVALNDYRYSEGFNNLAVAKVIEVTFVTDLTTTIDYENSVHIG